MKSSTKAQTELKLKMPNKAESGKTAAKTKVAEKLNASDASPSEEGDAGVLKKLRTPEDMQGEQRRKEYLSYKKRLAELEPNNYTKLYFIWQKGSWYRAFGHSAIIYHYEICPKLRRKSKLLDDKDFGLRIPGGVVNVSDIEILKEKLNELGIRFIDGDNTYCIFNLGKRYTQAELKYYEEARDREKASINMVILPKQVYPHLYKLCRELFATLYFVVAKMDKYAKSRLGNELVDRVNDVLLRYIMLSKEDGKWSEMGVEEFLEYVAESMFWLQAKMSAVMQVSDGNYESWADFEIDW